MSTIRRILVAVKNPAKAGPAVDKAGQLARGLGAHLELFHAISDPLFVDVLGTSQISLKSAQRVGRERTEASLEKLAAPLRRKGTKVSVCAEWDFPAHQAIIRQAVRSRANLIVAETHARGHVAPWLLRFTDWELLRLSPIPVLLVRTEEPYVRPKILAALDPTHAFEKPARLDAAILDIGATISEALRGTLHAMHAYVPSVVGKTPAELSSPVVIERIEQEAADAARKAMDKALRGSNIPAKRRHLVERHPVDAIPEVAREQGAAIVVMGAISRSGIRRVFIGNTAERVLDRLPCDVLIVKPRGFPNRVPRARRGPRYVTWSDFQ